MFRPIGSPLWIRLEDLIMAGHLQLITNISTPINVNGKNSSPATAHE